MSRLHGLPHSLQESIQRRTLLKVISGLNNFDSDSVRKIAIASDKGGADLIDLACDPKLVALVKSISSIPICVSAVDPLLFPAAVQAGAKVIEIGNFDSFYPEGRFFDAKEVIKLTIQTRSLLQDIPLSVTVPHTLPLDQQCRLAVDLVDYGADIIQTEGGTSSRPLAAGVLGCIEKACPTLAAAHSIYKHLDHLGYKIPIICASGLSSVTIPMAIATGASGVGVGSAINNLDNEISMFAAVKRLKRAVNSHKNNQSKQLSI
tara:strand:+ start:1111 stop:1896 length:786 start_codon:yes stop_codon:yes gene_type:complete